MKRLLFSVIAFSFLMLAIGLASASEVTMYSADGRTLQISQKDVETYKAIGWFETEDEVLSTMYAADGREIKVFKAQIDAYKSVGWYETKDEVSTTLYSMDGRQINVLKTEIEAYKAVGWYDDINDVTTIMCAPDGRKISVFRDQISEYIAVGWTPGQSDKIDLSKPMVAITFDDGPMREYTTRILNCLELYNARATFFVAGTMATGNEDLLIKMDSIGCQIGNHTYSHPDMTRLSRQTIASQLSTTENIINNSIGKNSTVIRPPYGSVNAHVASSVDKPMILWSLDTLDWKHRDSGYVTNEVLSKVRDGDIVLMHDIHLTSATAAEVIIPELIKLGYQLVTVDELARYKGYTLSVGDTYKSFR